MPFICSKLSSDQKYTIWNSRDKASNDLPQAERSVLVKGGAGIATKHLITPHGVVTSVTAEQIKMLKDNCPSFNRHEKNGFIKIMDKDPSASDVKKIAADLKEDKSAPVTPAKLKAEGKEAGKTNDKE